MTTNPGTDLVIDSSPISSEAIHNVSSAIASAASIQTNQSRGSNPSPQDNDQAQLATKESLENIVTYIINRFCKYGQGTTTEILQAVYIIDTMITNSKSGHFVLSAQNLFLTFILAIVVSHKLSVDTPFSNAWFANLFGIPLQVLNTNELIVLNLVHFSPAMDKHSYHRYYKALIPKSTPTHS